MQLLNNATSQLWDQSQKLWTKNVTKIEEQKKTPNYEALSRMGAFDRISSKFFRNRVSLFSAKRSVKESIYVRFHFTSDNCSLGIT